MGFTETRALDIYYGADRKPRDINGKQIGFIGEDIKGGHLATQIRFFFPDDGDLVETYAITIISKRADGQLRFDLCTRGSSEELGTYYYVGLSNWYLEKHGTLSLSVKVYCPADPLIDAVTIVDGVLTPADGTSVVVGTTFTFDVKYAPTPTTQVASEPLADWELVLMEVVTRPIFDDIIRVVYALPDLSGDVYDARMFLLVNAQNTTLYYINGSTPIEANIGTTIAKLLDCDIGSLVSGDVLSWNGTKWVNSQRLTTAEATIVSNTSRIGVNEALISNHEGRITTAEETLETLVDTGGIEVNKYPTYDDFPPIGSDLRLYLARDTDKLYHWENDDYEEVSNDVNIDTETDGGIVFWNATLGKIDTDANLKFDSNGFATPTIRTNIIKSMTSVSDVITINSEDNVTLIKGLSIGGDLNIAGNIIQQGSAYETHAEQVYTKDNTIILRDGAVGGLAVGSYAGLVAKLADGVNDAWLVFDGNGIAKVGDAGSLQVLATRQDTPTSNGIAYWNATDYRFDTSSGLVSDLGDNANAGLLINKSAGAGNIANFQFGGTNKLEITKDGFINQNGTRFIHNFQHLTGGGAIPIGRNIFVGISSGNLTMGVGASQIWHSSYNVGMGYNALLTNGNGYENIAIGASALQGNTTGYDNVGIGMASLSANTTGNKLVAIGLNSGKFIADGTTANTTSDFSIYIGADTKASADNAQNEIVIGYNAIGQGSNSVVLGNTDITKTILRGNVGINQTSPTSQLHIVSSATDKVGLIVDMPTSATANIQEWKVAGSTLVNINPSGQIFSTNYFRSALGIANSTSATYSTILTATTGTTISRNIADADNTYAALKINNQQGNGDIVKFQYGGSDKARIDKDGKFVSLITTGTSPMTIASTTLVSNLNADLLDGNEASAFQPLIPTGTNLEYYRGDKTWATLPTTLPASDVYAWAKASTKPSYSYSEITGTPPAIALTDVFTDTTFASFLTNVYIAPYTSVQEGDVVILSTDHKTYIHNGGTAGTSADFTELQTPTDVVTSVNGDTGVVVLDLDDIDDGSTRKLSDYSLTGHTHTIANITDASTIGQNIVKLTNPSRASYVRIGSDNTVTDYSPEQVLADIGASSSSHVHGNITTAGAIGSTASLPIITTTNGVLTTGTFGTTAGTFAQGDHTQAVDKGGTNITSYTAGDILYANGSTTLTKLAKGTAGQVLKMNSGETAPEWGTNTTTNYAGPSDTYLCSASSDGAVSVSDIDSYDAIVLEMSYAWGTNTIATTNVVFNIDSFTFYDSLESKGDGGVIVMAAKGSATMASCWVTRNNSAGTSLVFDFSSTGYSCNVYGRNW